MLHNNPTKTEKELNLFYVAKLTLAASVEMTLRYPIFCFRWQLNHSDYTFDPKQTYFTNFSNAIKAGLTDPYSKEFSLFAKFQAKFPGLVLDRVYTFGGQALLADKLQNFFNNDKIKANGISAIIIGFGHNYLSPFFKYEYAEPPSTLLAAVKNPARLFTLFTTPPLIQSKLTNPSKKEKMITQLCGAIASVLVATPFDNISKEAKSTITFKGNPFKGAGNKVLNRSLPLTFFMVLKDQMTSFAKDNNVQEKSRKLSL